MKKLQTPLEQFYNSTMNAAGHPSAVGIPDGENVPSNLNLPPKSKSPSRLPSGRFSTMIGAAKIVAAKAASPGTKSHTKEVLNASGVHVLALQEIQPPQLSDWKDLDAQDGSFSQRFVLMFWCFTLAFASLQNLLSCSVTITSPKRFCLQHKLLREGKEVDRRAS